MSHQRVTFGRVASLLSLTAALWTGSAVAAQACLCVGSPDPKGAIELTTELKSDLDAAFVVFVGEPIASNSLTIRFRVNAVWKGNLGTEVVMSTGAEATADGLIKSTSCDPSFPFGRSYLIFANGTSHETMVAHGCSFTGPLGDGGFLALLDGIVSRRHPSPDIAARDFVAVVGSVRTPGLVEWRPGMTVADALGLAGGAIAPVRREFAERKLTSSVSRNRLGDSNSFPALPTTPLGPRRQSVRRRRPRAATPLSVACRGSRRSACRAR